MVRVLDDACETGGINKYRGDGLTQPVASDPEILRTHMRVPATTSHSLDFTMPAAIS